jgi:hypothetical protein
LRPCNVVRLVMATIGRGGEGDVVGRCRLTLSNPCRNRLELST